MTVEKKVKNLEELDAEAARFARALAPAVVGATLVTLSGELGVGKTAYVKAAARALGVADVVSSPTFVLEKIYAIPKFRHPMSELTKLVHIDAYRLESGSELAPLRLEELMKDPNNLIMLEWPEKVADALPKATMRISIISDIDGSRTISYT